MSQVQQLKSDNSQRPSVYRISNLCVSFTKQRGTFRREKTVIRAVDNVSLEIHESEILSLVGESGSGKTTIARCIMALTAPTSGSIKYMGDTEVTKLKGKELLNYRKNVQIIFQDPFESLYPRFDVYSALSIPIKQLTGEHNASNLNDMVSKLLYEVGLDPAETLHKLPHQLSGGERQRVSIAKALAPNPKVLLADEPITMLDASLRLNMLSLLADLKSKRNLTILLITHDLASAKMMSERIAVMYSGKLVEVGATDVVLSRPHHPYTELILDSTPRLGRSEQEKITDEYVLNIEADEAVRRGCVFEPRCRYATSICKDVEPALVEKSNSHFAACHNALNLNEPK